MTWFRRVTLILLVSFGAGLGWRPVEASPLRQGGTTITPGVAVNGSLNDETFRQVYTFEGHTNEVISISMSRIEGNLDPYLLLTDERGTILALSDDNGSGMNAQIASKRIPADGTYVIIATRFGQEHGSTMGSYTLLLEYVGIEAGDTSIIAYGENILGRITPEEPLAFYFVRAQRGDVINISLRRTSGNLDPHLDLATPDGRILVSNDDDPLAEGTLDAGISNYTILETGIYLLVATRFGREAGDTTGSYVLSVEQTPPQELGTSPDMARLMDYGMALEGTIDDDVPERYYRFDAERGDVITVTMSVNDGNLDPLVRLTDTNFSELVMDDDSGGNKNARIAAYTLPNTGTYYLLATRAGGQGGKTAGAYTLELTGRPGVGGGQVLEIVYGATVNGLIDDQNSAEQYLFVGQQGDVIRISMERTSGDLDALITLLDGEGKQIAFDDDGGDDQNALLPEFVLPSEGMYVVIASRFDREAGTTSGAYLLTLDLIRPGGSE